MESVVAATNVSVTSLFNNKDTAPINGKSSVPLITTSQSAEYCHRLADISSRATLDEPLNNLFQQEKTGRSMVVTTDLLYAGIQKRTETKIAAGAFVVEAGNFAAVACWEPPSSNPPSTTEAGFQEIAVERPIFAQFVREIQESGEECFGKPIPPHWKLSLMARDPMRKDKGAVRAVIEPFIAKAKAEKVPLWLVAGSPRARDVYAYFGFKVIRVILSRRSEGDEGVPTWVMVCNWPVE